jgi:hypothetical protein
MLTLYYGFRNDLPGGLQTLILNIAKGCNYIGEEVKIITSPLSYVYKEALIKSIRFIFIDIDSDFRKQLNTNDIVICFGTLELHLSLFANTGVKIFYWTIFPDAFTSTFQIKLPFRQNKYDNRNFISRYYTKKLANLLFEKSSGYFMDDSHLKVIESYGIKNLFTQNNLLPIPIEVESGLTDAKIKSINQGPINIAYIGRAEDWKIYPFIRLVRDIKRCDFKNKIKLCIISEDGQAYLKFMDKIGVEYSDIELMLMNNIAGDELSEFLLREIHIVFAMGTSLLEACKVYVPAVIIDPSYSELADNYLYRFVFQEKGYCLGLPAWLIKNNAGFPLQYLYDNFFKNEDNYREIAKKSFDYVTHNHNLRTWLKQFLNAIRISSLKIDDLNWAHKILTKKQRIYSSFKFLDFQLDK